MRLRKRILTALLVTMFIPSCVPIIAGALIIKSSKTKAQKQQFMKEFNATNLERVKSGFEPLDWCSETYRFDKGWAISDPSCKDRIQRYEGGDVEALDIR